VGGHTDEDTDGGGALSLERARVIVRALEAAGVDGNRLEPRGYGDQFPVDEADTDAARQANQRGSISTEGV
jgi:outer membrane protein OmpA-like peptidoglycan-associated protein